MKLTREQELFLIQEGLNSIFSRILKPTKRKYTKRKKSKGWSKARRDAFEKKMEAKWKAKVESFLN